MVVYRMKSGALYQETGSKVLASIKSKFVNEEKSVLSADAVPDLQLSIDHLTNPKLQNSDVRLHAYEAKDMKGKIVMTGHPSYAKGEDPLEQGWPVNRTPRVDTVSFVWKGQRYAITMVNNQNYRITSQDSNDGVMEILHKGLFGGWDIKADDRFTPESICSIFVFCRYLEMENEFPIA